jgi:hypothetical protein
MRILLACLNVNGLGGSELYHYELARELYVAGNEIELFTFRNIDRSDQVRIRLNELGISQTDLLTIDTGKKYDIIVASQPEVNRYILSTFKDTPIISIIHSEIRSEDPILDHRIKHYVGIRQSIVDMLINDYKINKENVSLIYNPIDTSRFKPTKKIHSDRIKGIFVGEVLDSIRFTAINHIAQQCIENDWDLYIMSDSRYNFNHSNIKYLDKRWDTESVVQTMNFTAGILLGRTTLEGWSCDIPGYIYTIDIDGNILNIETDIPTNIKQLCNSSYVANQHIQLYNKIINRFNLNLKN